MKPAVGTVAGSRIEVVEVLRGLAALSVAWFHFTQNSMLQAEGFLKASGSFGWLGVEAFFVISGFVIPYSMARAGYSVRAHWGTFVFKRIVRLEPPYLAAVGLTIGLLFLSAQSPDFRGPPPVLDWQQVLLHVGYLNAYFNVPWLVPVFWSLAIEFQYYIAISVAYPVLVAESAAIRVGSLAFFCVLGLLLPSPVWLFHFAPLFALGVAVFWRYTGQAGGRPFLAMLAACAGFSALTQGIAVALTGLATALCIAYLRAPRQPLLAVLGTISYSLYLIHVPVGARVVNLGSRVVDEPLGKLLVVLAAVAVSLLAAAALYALVERPARAWSGRLAYRSAAAARVYSTN